MRCIWKTDTKDIHEFAMNEFGMSKSTVNHCIRINEQFSIGGNSPDIEERYKDFSKSQLQEMLYIPEDKREDVTPGMTVKEIRSLKEEALDVEPEVVDEQIPDQMTVYDYQDVVPEQQGPEIRKPSPEEKMILDAFAKQLIRDEKAYFRADYAARVLNVITAEEQLKDYLGAYNRCWYFWSSEKEYHINLFDDYVQLWLDHPVGCIGNFEWFYLMAAVQSMWNVVAMEDAERNVQIRKDTGEADAAEQVLEEDEADDEQQDPEENEGQQVTVQLLLEKEKGKLNQYLDAYKDEKSLPAFIEEQKIIVAALAGMACDLEAAEEPGSGRNGTSGYEE